MAVLFYVALVPTNTYAELQSAHYQLDESVIGVGDVSQGASSHFTAINSLGDVAVGNSASGSYQVEAGSQTTQYPTLSFTVNNGNADFGTFSPIKGAVTSTSFSVSNYTSYGYVVQVAGNPPTFGGHTITAMSSTGPPQTGIEQFGINLVANTIPSSIGANPDNGQFGFGSVDANYSSSNQYRYVNGEMVALAAKSSGTTTYTISYMVNVSSITPSGQYTSNQTVIITGTY